VRLRAKLERDESGMIVVECPSIPGCVSEGATEAEAVENIREAIEGCLRARRANDMPLIVSVPEVEG
jgi:predicted RNase H-like HicB family nuclease